MLIRVTGGKAGIAEYLENGVKNGRDLSRDELDQRYIIDGDLSVTNSIINNMDNKGEKYLHVTLAFKEDYISEETLQELTTEFKAFALRAYDDDEYNFYAEAHLPKVKSYVDKATGEIVDRKPHIHIVVPEVNLKTGKKLEPFGMVDNNKKYIDAFQEVINEKYNLASPKIEVRPPTDKSTLVSRQKGDLFPSLNRDTKANVLNIVLEKNISSLSELSDSLKQSNYTVIVRNKGTDNEYLNIKAPDQKKGINLKEAVFQPTFLQLNKQEKEKALNPDIHYRVNKSYTASQEHHKNLAHWENTRAYELRYINYRNRKEYKSLNNTDKTNFLNEKRGHNESRRISTRSFDHIKRTLRDVNETLGTAERYLSNAQRHSNKFESGIRNITHRRAIRAVISNSNGHSRDQRNTNKQSEPVNDILGQYKIRLNTPKNITEIKKETDANKLLESLSISHGLIKEKYEVTTAKDGSHRIKCGNRNFNVSDFLTKEMNMPWKEAKRYLENHTSLEYRKTPAPSKNIISAAWQVQINKEKKERLEYLEQYKIEKKAIYSDTSLTKLERNQALSIVQMNKVISDIHFKKKTTTERESLTARSLSIKKGNIMSDNEIKSAVQKSNNPNIEASKILDRNLEASRLLYHYPKLKELGISPTDINKTDKGDRIKYNDKELSVTQLMKETHNLKPKEIIEQLKPLYDTQEADKKRVQEYKDKFMVEHRVSIRDMEKEEKNKEKTQKENTLSPSTYQQEKQSADINPIKPISISENIHHKINKDGHITYYQDSNKLVTDRGKDIIVESQNNKAIEVGLRLAIEKYGKVLDVKGDEEYKKQIIQSAAINKLNITFVDKQMNIELDQARANLTRGENVIAKATQAQSSNQEAQKEVVQSRKNTGFER
ncbi:LPD7 domain-containing protein [Photobacterium phosphoreum]|uniref:LPD7 domain-containing protein n=1 Tax=Photobacterium phosphoreum TaxID=659 RepID=UPI0024B79051|nr:LPD7 domain-containing protein [Photobacterium phosphoreum]